MLRHASTPSSPALCSIDVRVSPSASLRASAAPVSADVRGSRSGARKDDAQRFGESSPIGTAQGVSARASTIIEVLTLLP